MRYPVVTSIAIIAAVAGSASVAQSLQPKLDQVQLSNEFFENLRKLHQQQIDGKKIRETEEFGGYKDLPQFYREVSYYDAATGRLLSRIQWERENPTRIHAIEVFVYDDQGRVARDYSTWFLPRYRNAPRETNINLYNYGDGIRAWRQFDVFGNRMYEKCSAGERVLVELWGDDISRAQDDPKSVMHGPDYRRCFATLATTPGKYVVPQ
ncbi:MAG: hypothetical protein ACLGHO_02895 [Gammaproteobacteria bacterium]